MGDYVFWRRIDYFARAPARREASGIDIVELEREAPDSSGQVPGSRIRRHPNPTTQRRRNPEPFGPQSAAGQLHERVPLIARTTAVRREGSPRPLRRSDRRQPRRFGWWLWQLRDRRRRRSRRVAELGARQPARDLLVGSRTGRPISTSPIGPARRRDSCLDDARRTRAEPAYSPTARRSRFTATATATSRSTSMRPNGEAQQRLTNHPGRDQAPTWSPRRHARSCSCPTATIRSSTSIA